MIEPGTIALVGCGFAMAMPEGYEAQVRPRSGLASKHGLTVVNTPGTIDADYRGEVKVALINLGRAAVTVDRGMRIAQMVVAPVTRSSMGAGDRAALNRQGRRGFWFDWLIRFGQVSRVVLRVFAPSCHRDCGRCRRSGFDRSACGGATTTAAHAAGLAVCRPARPVDGAGVGRQRRAGVSSRPFRSRFLGDAADGARRSRRDAPPHRRRARARHQDYRRRRRRQRRARPFFSVAAVPAGGRNRAALRSAGCGCGPRRGVDRVSGRPTGGCPKAGSRPLEGAAGRSGPDLHGRARAGIAVARQRAAGPAGGRPGHEGLFRDDAPLVPGTQPPDGDPVSPGILGPTFELRSSTDERLGQLPLVRQPGSDDQQTYLSEFRVPWRSLSRGHDRTRRDGRDRAARPRCPLPAQPNALESPRVPYRLETKLFVPAPVPDVFRFFTDARNLETLTPPFLRFRC